MTNVMREHLSQRGLLWAAILSAAACLGTDARAADDDTGLYLTLEGIVGLNGSHRTGLNNSYTDQPVLENAWQGFGADIEGLTGGRVEAGWMFETASGAHLQLSVEYSRWTGSTSKSDMIYGFVYGEPPVVTGGPPQPEVRICIQDPCAEMVASVDHSYWEFAPKLSAVVGGTDGSFFWLGIQPFYGQVDEDSYTTNRRQGVDNTLNAQLFGAMLTGQKDFRLSDSNTLSVDAALGWYKIEADSFSKGVTKGGEIRDSQDEDGTRAQLGVGFDHKINSNLSFGAGARLDYWSSQPYTLTSSDIGVPCVPTIGGPACSPPRVKIFQDSIQFDDMMDYFLGLNVTFRY